MSLPAHGKENLIERPVIRLSRWVSIKISLFARKRMNPSLLAMRLSV